MLGTGGTDAASHIFLFSSSAGAFLDSIFGLVAGAVNDELEVVDDPEDEPFPSAASTVPDFALTASRCRDHFLVSPRKPNNSETASNVRLQCFPSPHSTDPQPPWYCYFVGKL